MNSSALNRGWFALDHIFDHLPIRTTWKQCDGEHRKASFSDTRAPKSPRNQGKNYHLTLRVLETVGSHSKRSRGELAHKRRAIGIFASGENLVIKSIQPQVLRRLAIIVASRAEFSASDAPCFARGRRQNSYKLFAVRLPAASTGGKLPPSSIGEVRHRFLP